MLGDVSKIKTSTDTHLAYCLTCCGKAVFRFLLHLRRLLLALGLISAAAGGRWRAVRREGGVNSLDRRVTPLQQQVHTLRQERQLQL